LIVLFCGGLMLTPILASAEGDGDRILRIKRCAWNEYTAVCRKSTTGPLCHQEVRCGIFNNKF
jgi:hypothetical protein